MKKLSVILFVLIFFLTTSFNTSLDIYQVIKVIGTIYSEDKDKNIDTGDEITQEENLNFKSSDAQATVINPEKGRFIIKANSESTNKTDFIPPMSHHTRAFGDISNLKKYFMDDFAVIDSINIRLNKSTFQLDENKYFVIKFVSNGDTLEKKLSNTRNNLILNKNEIYKHEGLIVRNTDTNNVMIYYVKNGVYNYQTKFKLYFLNEEQLKKETTIIINASDFKSEEKRAIDVTSYIYDTYAKTEQSHVQEWLKNNFE